MYEEVVMKLMLRLIIITLSIIGAVLLYNHFYTVDINSNIKAELSDYLDKDVELITSKAIGDEYDIHFNYDNNGVIYEGRAVLQEGYNDLYRFSYINYENETNGFVYNCSTEIVMISCGLVIMFGMITSFMFTKELNLLERLYGKITGDPLYIKR